MVVARVDVWSRAAISEGLAPQVRKVPKAVIRARQLFARLAPISRYVRADEMPFYS